MASIFANCPAALLVARAQTHQGRTRTAAFSTVSSLQGTDPDSGANRAKDRPKRVAVVKAMGEGSESSTSLSIVQSVQNLWDKSEDRVALIGLGFAGIAAFWASANLITAIDTLPIIPGTLEIIGILFSTWFTYRYLLFKPGREEIVLIINKSISEVLGQ